MKTLKSGKVLTPLGIGVAFSLFGDSTLYTVLPREDIAVQAGVTLSMVGLLLGLNRVARMASNGPVGLLFDRLPRRPIMILSLFFGAISTLLYAVSYGSGPYLFARLLWGVCWSGIWIGANTMALDISSDGDRGHINGRLQMWFFLGVALTNFTGGFFTDLFGYREGLWVSTILTLVGVLIWVIFLPETRDAITKNNPTRDGNDSDSQAFPWRKVLQAAYPLFAVRLVFAGVLASTTILWLQQFIDKGVSISGFFVPLATATGMFSAVRVLISIISAPLSGKSSDRIGRRWPVIVFLFAAGTIGMMFMASNNFALAVCGAFLSAATGGGIQAISPSLIGDTMGNNSHGRALGIVYTIGDLGSALGPPAALLLIPILGIGAVYILCSVIFFLILCYSIYRTTKEKTIKVNLS